MSAAAAPVLAPKKRQRQRCEIVAGPGPVGGADHAPAEQRNVEAILRGPHVLGFLLTGEQVEEQGAEPLTLQGLRRPRGCGG